MKMNGYYFPDDEKEGEGKEKRGRQEREEGGQEGNEENGIEPKRKKLE
jgi:hypothetical protein